MIVYFEFVENTALLRNILEDHFRILGTFGTFGRSGWKTTDLHTALL
jgi:hypothetical protein